MGNSNAESFMKPLNKVLKTAHIEDKKWKHELQKFLLNYRSTPHTTTKVASAELHSIDKSEDFCPRSQVRKLLKKHKLAHDNIIARKDTNKIYHDTYQKVMESDINVGDAVICKQRKTNKLTPLFSPDKLIVYQKKRNNNIC